MSEPVTLAALCLATAVGFGAERAEATTHRAIEIEGDGRRVVALATLPQAWRSGAPALLLVSRSPGTEAWRDHAASTVLPWGVAVVDWPGWTGLDAADGARRIGEQLDPGAIAAVEPSTPHGALRVVLAPPEDEAEQVSALSCALDALVAARGHDAIAP